jgi:hypothetical protein
MLTSRHPGPAMRLNGQPAGLRSAVILSASCSNEAQSPVLTCWSLLEDNWSSVPSTFRIGFTRASLVAGCIACFDYHPRSLDMITQRIWWLMRGDLHSAASREGLPPRGHLRRPPWVASRCVPCAVSSCLRNTEYPHRPPNCSHSPQAFWQTRIHRHGH